MPTDDDDLESTQYDNSDDTSPNFDILDRLENYRIEDDGRFVFKMTWPVMLVGMRSTQIWAQTSNPAWERIAGYEDLRVECTDANWGGLERSVFGKRNNTDPSRTAWDASINMDTGEQTLSFMDGSVNSSGTSFAIRIRRLVRGGIPACGDSIARMAELYVWDGKFVGNRIAAVAERGARYRRLDFIQLRIN